MSVHVSDRGVSPVEFLVKLKQLSLFVNKFVVRRSRDSKSFRNIYAEKLCALALDAYVKADQANTIFISEQFSRQDLELRRALFQEAYGYVKNIQCAFELYIKTIVDEGLIKEAKANKALEYVSITSYEIRKSITNIIKKDVEKATRQNNARLKKEKDKLEKLFKNSDTKVIISNPDCGVIRIEKDPNIINTHVIDTIESALIEKEKANMYMINKAETRVNKNKKKIKCKKNKNKFLDNLTSSSDNVKITSEISENENIPCPIEFFDIENNK